MSFHYVYHRTLWRVCFDNFPPEKRYIHLCEFREKVRQYCINKFVRTTLLSKNIILFENNTYILVKKFGRRTLRESNDSVKHSPKIVY